MTPKKSSSSPSRSVGGRAADRSALRGPRCLPTVTSTLTQWPSRTGGRAAGTQCPDSLMDALARYPDSPIRTSGAPLRQSPPTAASASTTTPSTSSQQSQAKAHQSPSAADQDSHNRSMLSSGMRWFTLLAAGLVVSLAGCGGARHGTAPTDAPATPSGSVASTQVEVFLLQGEGLKPVRRQLASENGRGRGIRAAEGADRGRDQGGHPHPGAEDDTAAPRLRQRWYRHDRSEPPVRGGNRQGLASCPACPARLDGDRRPERHRCSPLDRRPGCQLVGARDLGRQHADSNECRSAQACAPSAHHGCPGQQRAGIGGRGEHQMDPAATGRARVSTQLGSDRPPRPLDTRRRHRLPGLGEARTRRDPRPDHDRPPPHGQTSHTLRPERASGSRSTSPRRSHCS